MSKTAIKQKRKEKVSAKNRDERRDMNLVLVAVIILLAFGVRYIGLGDVGVTYDEPIYVSTGMQYASALGQLNFSGSAWTINMEHPPVSKYIYGAAINLMGATEGDYRTFMVAKLASALMGAATCALVFLIGRDFMSRKIGITSALLLVFTPVFLANTQIASLESPLALFFTLTIYLFLIALKQGSRNFFLGAAVACGLTVGTKYNGIFVLPVLALVFGLFTLEQVWKKEGSLNVEAVRRNLGTLVPVKGIAAFLAIAGGLFFVLWPWLWTDPVGHLSQSLGHWTTAPQEYFLGTLQSAPIYYYPVYFAVTTPLLLFLPLAAGAIALARSRDALKIGILLWLIVPFAYGLSTFVQDGMRYLIVIYPALALVCGCGLWSAAEWIGDRYKTIGREKTFAVVSALAVVYLILSAVSVYPYYLDYYNSLAGGPHGAYEHRSFEFSWWGEGIKSAMDYVENTAPAGSVVLMLTDPDDYVNFAAEEGNMNYCYPFIMHTSLKDAALNFSQPIMAVYHGENKGVIPNYVITNFRVEEYRNITVADVNYSLVREVQVQGAPLVKVYKDMRSQI